MIHPRRNDGRAGLLKTEGATAENPTVATARLPRWLRRESGIQQPVSMLVSTAPTTSKPSVLGRASTAMHGAVRKSRHTPLFNACYCELPFRHTGPENEKNFVLGKDGRRRGGLL